MVLINADKNPYKYIFCSRQSAILELFRISSETKTNLDLDNT